MNAKTIFPSKYIKAEDLQGKAVNVQIAALEVEEVGKNKDRKPVLYFRGKEKGLILNKTNINKICEILGTDETEEWFGGLIQIYPTEVDFAGAATLAVRVKAPSTSNGSTPKRPEPPPPPPAHEPGDDDVPF